MPETLLNQITQTDQLDNIARTNRSMVLSSNKNMCLFTNICIFKININSFHVSLNSKSWYCLFFGLKQLLLYSLILPLPDLE